MRFKQRVLLALVVAGAALTGTVIYFLNKAAAESERVHQAEQAESECADKVPIAVALVQRRDSMQGARIQVTGSAFHFNHQLKQCLVEVSTFEHQDGPVYVKSLVNVASGSLTLWSIAPDTRGLVRKCFSENAKQVDCGEVDKQWKKLMKE